MRLNINFIKSPKKMIIILVVLIIIAVGSYFLTKYLAKGKEQRAHEKEYKQVCANGGRKYFREYLTRGENKEKILVEGCR